MLSIPDSYCIPLHCVCQYPTQTQQSKIPNSMQLRSRLDTVVTWDSPHSTRDQQNHIWRPRPRLKMSKSQWQDWDWKDVSQWRDRGQKWKCLSLNDETKTEKIWVSMTRLKISILRLIETEIFHGNWECNSSRLRNFLDAETKTPSRPVLISPTHPPNCQMDFQIEAN